MREKILTLVAALAVGAWGLAGCEEFDQPPADGPVQQEPGEAADQSGEPQPGQTDDTLGAPGDADDDEFGQPNGGTLEGFGDQPAGSGDEGDLPPPPAPEQQ